MGDRWSRLQVSSLDTLYYTPPATYVPYVRSIGRPCILNTYFRYKAVTFAKDAATTTVNTTTLSKNELIFTNIKYPMRDKTGPQDTFGQQFIDLADTFRRYELYSNKNPSESQTTYAGQKQDNVNWIVDFDCERWQNIPGGPPPSKFLPLFK
jgi:hypothetical protein